jgi:hypothetical protein
MTAKEIVEGMIEKSVERYQTYAYATGVLSVVVLGLLDYLEPRHKENILRELTEITEKI